MGKLNNQVAIVTGAGGGFGEGIAALYVQEGAKVVVADIREDAAKAVAARLGPNASAFVCDVANGASVQALVDYTAKTFGTPNIVVNNAGVTHVNKPMLDVNEAEFDRVYAASENASKPPMTLNQTLRISQSASWANTVVWNPASDLCSRLTDMPEEGWRHMLCVEAAQVFEPISLASGQQWLGWQHLQVLND